MLLLTVAFLERLTSINEMAAPTVDKLIIREGGLVTTAHPGVLSILSSYRLTSLVN